MTVGKETRYDARERVQFVTFLTRHLFPKTDKKKVRHVDHYKRVLCLRKESSFMSF